MLIFFISSIVYAQSLDSLFVQANKLYQQESYIEALKLYQEIENNDVESSALYYNMANIMSQEKREGFSHFYLGQYYSKIKKYKNAKFHFNKALDTLDDSKLIKEAEKLLKQISKQEKSSKT